MTDDQWMREVLDDAVSDVEPGNGLESIRARTRVTPMSSRRPWLFGAGGAVLATAATITAFAVLGSGGDQNAQDPGPAGTPTASQTPGDDPTRATSGPTGAAVAVPVYYLAEVSFHQGEGGEMQTAFRLFREWHETTAVDDASSAEEFAEAALNEMLTGAALDPDYASLWAEGVGVDSVTHQDGVITVDLTGPVEETNVGSETAELSIQQLVYTAQAALSYKQDPAPTDPVRILLDGEAVNELWGHVDTSTPIARADRTGTQAPIWVTAPANGASVPSPVKVEGVAQVFEATVTWRVLKEGNVVDEGVTSASEGAPAFGDFAFEVPLEPGDYTIEVYEASALDGSVTFLDSKQVTVE